MNDFNNRIQKLKTAGNLKPSDSKILYKGGITPTDAIPYEITLYRITQDIARWRAALIRAENIHYPNRTELYRTFKDVVLDLHLCSVMDQRKKPILSANFNVVDINGEIDEERTKLIQKKWFYDFINLSLDSIFYGYSLIQFGEMINWEFQDVSIVPRHHVKQELGIIVENLGQMDGVDYLKNNWCVGIGNVKDLGLLSVISGPALLKKNAITGWGEYSEMFGSPVRVLKSDERNEKSKNEMMNYLQNAGPASGIVINREEDLEFVSASTGGEVVYEKLIDKCNQEISKVVLGQTGTTDEKAFVGSAAVHERVMHQYNDADQRLIEFVIQNKLLPFLIDKGFDLQGYNIIVEEADELSLVEKSKIDIALSRYYEIDPKYLLEKYGTEIIGPQQKIVKTDGGDQPSI
jgi:phage gp29-like protein